MPFLLILSVTLLIAAIATSVVVRKLSSSGSVVTRPERVEYEDNYAFGQRLSEWERTQRNGVDRLSIPRWVARGLYVTAILALIFSSLTMVGTKQVGVVTTFNRPVDTMTNGLHLKAPWQKVTEMDGTIQTDNYVGAGDKGSCIKVRIGNGSVACIDTTSRWRIVANEADVLFQDYRNRDDVNLAIKESLVKRELNGALNDVYGDYDPLAAVKGVKTVGVGSLSTDTQAAIIERVKKLGNGIAQVEILSVTTPLIHLDAPTQSKIDAYQQEVANTRIAEQKEETAKAEAKANVAITDSISKDPNVLAYKCLNIMESMVNTPAGVPSGMYCFPGGNSPVVLPGTTK
ncbi:MAG: SPFH domain-containing protein [Candidatus Saccharimonadales bacterium]